MIPSFPEFKPLELADRDAVEACCRQLQPHASEYTFTNLFAWQDVNDYQVAQYAGGLLIRKEAHGRRAFLQPLVAAADARDAVRDCLAYLAEHGAVPRIERVGEDFLARLGEDMPCTAHPDRDNADYVYSVRELTALRGEKFHDKKNLLNQFTGRYAYTYHPLTAELAPRCLAFAHEWCEERDCEKSEGLKQERCAVTRMLTHFAELHAVGGVIEVEGDVAAFTLGEPLTPDTYVIHIEKARGSMTGAYQTINREFLRHAAADYAYVNREQDLGIPGLRRAKSSYNPVRMVHKYTLSPRE